MEQLISFLNGVVGDVFKLLPMKEDELNGVDNHLSEYLDNLIVNVNGAIRTYPELINNKEYLNVINNLNYLSMTDIKFTKWRTIILNSAKCLSNLRDFYKGE